MSSLQKMAKNRQQQEKENEKNFEKAVEQILESGKRVTNEELKKKNKKKD